MGAGPPWQHRPAMGRPPFPYLAAAAALPAACGQDAAGPDAEPPPDAAVPPAFRNPVDLPDDELATRALQLLGAPVPGADRNCNICHGLTRARLRDWADLSAAALTGCLTDLAIERRDDAAAMIACLREDPDEPGAPFAAARLGYYATAAHLDWFRYLFALGAPDEAETLHGDFEARVLMPRGAHPPFDQAELDIVAEWVARDLPLLDELLPGDPDPGACLPSIAPAVGQHVAAMATQGWGAVNRDAGLNLHGCAGAATPRACLASYPRATTTPYGATWEADLPGAVLRVLRVNGYRSSFWTRSSADGRYVGHGGRGTAQGNSTIVDLAGDRLIGTRALYDPGFFPDNSGFGFQASVPGQQSRVDAYLCDQRMLAGDDYISYDEEGCRRAAEVGLYQHFGAALGGGDYWTVDSQFVSDDGGKQPTLRDPRASFDGSAAANLVPLIHDGTGYQARPRVSVPTPGEGDTVMSPSARLLVTRVAGPGSAQVGFRLRQLLATPSGDSYTVEVPEIGRYCDNGGKPGLSFDERWLAIHHYVDADDAVDLGFTGAADPAFAPYLSQGAANVYLIDLLSGDRTRVTRMAPGQYALFPHFRSDGWMYFVVRTAGSGTEYIVASEAALVVAGQ
jgi:hypothetical protein